MTPEERRAYARGYHAGSRSAWPEHRPPRPPDELCAELIDAMRRLRDCADGWLAMFCAEDDDQMHSEIAEGIDHADVVLAKVSEWLRGKGGGE